MNVDVKVIDPHEYMDSLTGIMYYSFSNMKLLPRNNDDFHDYSDPVQGNPTSIDHGIKGKSLNIFPNPTADKVKLTIDGPVSSSDENYRVVISDLTGKTVLKRSMPAGKSEISLQLGHLEKGAYMISVIGADTGLMKHEKVILD